MLRGIDLDATSGVRLAGDIDPHTGAVDGQMTATLPVGAAATSVHLRWLPGIVAADASIDSVTVGGVDVKPDVDESLITLLLAPGHGDHVDVAIDSRSACRC